MGISLFVSLAMMAILPYTGGAFFAEETPPIVMVLPPLPPDTSSPAATEPALDIAAIQAQVEAELHPEARFPSRLSIPSIGLKAPVVQVGINEKGEMDVPDGSTKKVGWYRYGTVPGDTGSAVMDAHVYAAFSKLKHVKVGSHIYVTDEKGETLDFLVKDSRVYALAEVPLEYLFNRADAKRLNLITCAGRYSRTLGTYEKRLIVYAELQ